MDLFVHQASLILVLVFLAYLSMIVWAYLRQQPRELGDPADFEWHIFIPCCDEEFVIGQTLEWMRQDFPLPHFWVIDDGSTDRTASVVEDLALVDPKIHLVRRVAPNARTGKGDALNAAYRALNEFLSPETNRKRVVVGVVDADGELDPACLSFLSSDSVFGDRAVGAAQLAVHMANAFDSQILPGKGPIRRAFGRYLVRMQDIEFRTTIAAMQAFRGRTQSVGLGGNGQFTRLSVLDLIATKAQEPWHGALLEDYELGLHVMLVGYQNRYLDDSYVAQEALTDLPRLLKQRTRWSQGNMQCLKYLKQIAKSPYISTTGAFESAYFLIWPFAELIGIAVFPLATYYVLSDTSHVASLGLGTWLSVYWWLVALTAIFGVVPFVMWGPIYKLKCEPSASWLTSLVWGIGVFFYTYYIYVVVIRAAWRIVRGNSGWDKTQRNSELDLPSAQVMEAA